MLSRTIFQKSVGVSSLRRSFSTSVAMRADDNAAPGSAGATARSAAFSKREKAAEDQYILEHEREKYQQAKKALEKQKQELEELEKKADSQKK